VLNASLYYHTLRHLRPQQFFGRLRRQILAPKPAVRATPPLAPWNGLWTAPPEKRCSLLGPARVRFLNRERELALPADWHAGAERLWLYNLHYFDDLVAEGATQRRGWHEALFTGWVRDNPPAGGVGWEPYPVSLRAVNWIKWSLAGNRLDPVALQSLATQLRHLRPRIEWHLLGNHLLVNAKALFFGGLFFFDGEADEWLECGARLLEQELQEQVLSDGAHFERSPMYHALVLEDVLDALNALRTYSERALSRRLVLTKLLASTAARMLAWLEWITHPDGDIAFFNDSTFGVAALPSKLRSYAYALGVAPDGPPASSAPGSSGYVRLEQTPWCAMFDAADVGPDYQPGHAHADTLAFELSFNKERIITNSGTSTYEQGPQRAFERSTRAHNTVEIDGKDSSEVWAAFRVARRARPFERRIDIRSGTAAASCAHDGYCRLRGRPVHRRRLEVTQCKVRWTDRVEGSGSHRAAGFIPVHPGIDVRIQGPRATLITPNGRKLVLRAESIQRFALEEGSYAREFGLLQRRPVVTWERVGRLPLEAGFELAAER
jgi:uncharacterized heparinase superfamily protein